MYHTDDTIAAIATPAGGGARGIVRVSGPNAVAIVAKCFSVDDGRRLDRIMHSSVITGLVSVSLRDGASPESHSSKLECDLFLWPGTRSYTRQPLAELHTFGSPPLLDAVLAAVCRAGARLAEPGEFTLRAFLAGRVDLTQAEAVLGVIDARGEADLAAALSQLAGGLARPLTQLRDDLLQLLAELEAGLDFVDEDIRFVSGGEVVARLTAAKRLLDDIVAQMTQRYTADRLGQVVLLGPPNAGKSSLFNALISHAAATGRHTAGRTSPALVSAVRGTTRDYLTARLLLDGVECELVDTAGADWEALPPHRSIGTAEAIDAAAHSLAAERREQAAVCVWCVDASAPDHASIAHQLPPSLDSSREIIAFTKSDLAPAVREFPAGQSAVMTSSVKSQGLAELGDAIRSMLARSQAEGQAQVVATTAERCRESVRLAGEAVERAARIVSTDGGDELAAAEIHSAIDELGRVVGAVYTDDLLDRIFSTFCIGK